MTILNPLKGIGSLRTVWNRLKLPLSTFYTQPSLSHVAPELYFLRSARSTGPSAESCAHGALCSSQTGLVPQALDPAVQLCTAFLMESRDAWRWSNHAEPKRDGDGQGFKGRKAPRFAAAGSPCWKAPKRLVPFHCVSFGSNSWAQLASFGLILDPF